VEVKPASHWLNIPLQIAAAIFCVLWYFHLPSPNKAVLAMATMVALMMLIDIKPLHRGIYFLLVIAFFVLENRAIDKERGDAAKNLQAINSELKQTFDWISGGEAFTAVMVDLHTMQLEVSTKGPQPLRDVYINVFNATHASENPASVRETARIISVGTVYPTVLRHLEYQLPVTGDSASFFIRIYQLNGSFSESLNLVRQNNSWTVQSMGLSRDKDGKQLIP